MNYNYNNNRSNYSIEEWFDELFDINQLSYYDPSKHVSAQYHEAEDRAFGYYVNGDISSALRHFYRALHLRILDGQMYGTLHKPHTHYIGFIYTCMDIAVEGYRLSREDWYVFDQAQVIYELSASGSCYFNEQRLNAYTRHKKAFKSRCKQASVFIRTGRRPQRSFETHRCPEVTPLKELQVKYMRY